MFFEKRKKSTRNDIKVYTHLFNVNHLGERAGLKNIRLHDLDSAFETWNELIDGGWAEVTNQFQESA